MRRRLFSGTVRGQGEAYEALGKDPTGFTHADREFERMRREYSTAGLEAAPRPVTDAMGGEPGQGASCAGPRTITCPGSSRDRDDPYPSGVPGA